MAEEHEFEEVEENVTEEQGTEQVPEEDVASAAEQEGERQSKHDDRVASIAAMLAELVVKGEEVVNAINGTAEAADGSFAQKAASVNAKMDSFAASMQEQMDRAADQFARDLEVIAQAVNNASATNEATKDEPCAPQFTPAALAFRERMGVEADGGLTATDPEFVERFANFAFDDVPSDVELADRTRFICWLATLLGCQGIDEFRELLPAALNMGVEPEAVKEVVYQASAYLGIGRVYPFLVVTNEVFAERGIELPLKPQATTSPTEESRYEGGEQAQMAAIGPRVRGFKDKGNPDYPWINQWLVKHCFGDWYTRGGLTMPEREMITFCFIAAQGGCEAQLRAHTAANVQCGNDRDFLIKVVSNNVPFIGYPRSLNAMAIVEEITGAKE